MSTRTSALRGLSLHIVIDSSRSCSARQVSQSGERDGAGKTMDVCVNEHKVAAWERAFLGAPIESCSRGTRHGEGARSFGGGPEERGIGGALCKTVA